MRYWIYSANPERYRIEERLRDPRAEITWIVTRYADLTHPGDIAFLWITGKDRGIVGAIRLLSEPTLMEELASEKVFWTEHSNAPATRVLAELTHRVALIPAMRLRNIPELMKCSVFHGFQQATNFMLTEKEGQIFWDLVENTNSI